VLRSSPLAAFESLINTAHYPLLMRSEFVFLEAGPIDCYLIGSNHGGGLFAKESGPALLWYGCGLTDILYQFDREYNSTGSASDFSFACIVESS
jgi:hypothetical protein